MNKILLLSAVFLSAMFLNAAEPEWDVSEDLSLKKDEIYQTEFSYLGTPKKLYFYWTLYKNYGLVVNLKYDKFPYQFILYTDYKRKSFKIPLSQGDDINKDTYLVLSFKDYDEESKKATLWLGIMLPKVIKNK